LGHAADVGFDDLVGELRDAFAVDFGFGDLQAELARVVDLARDLADVQERLGGDAAPVQAHAADLVAVEAHDLLAELAEPDRGVVAARAGADDERVDGERCHGMLFARRGREPPLRPGKGPLLPLGRTACATRRSRAGR